MTKSSTLAWDPDLAHEVPIEVITPGSESAVHVQCLRIAAMLARRCTRDAVNPERVIDVLNRACVRFVLIGGYAECGWTNTPRATADVDVWVPPRQLATAV